MNFMEGGEVKTEKKKKKREGEKEGRGTEDRQRASRWLGEGHPQGKNWSQ